MKYKVWNKKEPIKGFEADYWINELGLIESDGVFLILNNIDDVEWVEVDRIIKGNYNLDQNLTTEQVAQEYIRIKKEEKLQSEKEQITLEEQAKKISILQDENEKLNTQLNTVRASHSDLILDLDFRVMDIEDNLGIVPMKINLFNILGGEDNMNSTFMVVLDKIETGNYKTKDEIESICDRYLARERITGEEYDMLMKALDKKEAEKNQVIQ